MHVKRRKRRVITTHSLPSCSSTQSCCLTSLGMQKHWTERPLPAPVRPPGMLKSGLYTHWAVEAACTHGRPVTRGGASLPHSITSLGSTGKVMPADTLARQFDDTLRPLRLCTKDSEERDLSLKLIQARNAASCRHQGCKGGGLSVRYLLPYVHLGM